MTQQSSRMSDARLRRLLEQPQAPDWLAEKLRCNLEHQANKEYQRGTRGYWALGLSLAANVVLSIWLFTGTHPTPVQPTFVEQALAHLRSEATLHGALDGGYAHWLQRNDIHAPPAVFRVAMSKNCHIGAVKAKHIRLISQQNTPINLMIYSRTLPAGSPNESSGTIQGMRWVAFRVRGDMYALAMFNKNTPLHEVRALLHSMFPHDPSHNTYIG